MIPAQTFTFEHTSETELARCVLAHLGPNQVMVDPNDTNRISVVFTLRGRVHNFESIDELSEFLVARKVYSRTTKKYTKNAPTSGRIQWAVLQTLI